MFLSLMACSEKESSEITTEPNTIMAILAHPDDESAIGQILARYADEGKKVYLVIAADG